jgi:hypothetical protein
MGERPNHGTARKEGHPARYHQALALRLRLACEDLTYAEISRLTGCNHESVRRYVQGITTPPPEFLAAICEHLFISPQWLLIGTGPIEAGLSLRNDVAALRNSLAAMLDEIAQLAALEPTGARNHTARPPRPTRI